VNVTDKIRISCDTRYYLKSEPVDRRWDGKNPTAHEINEESKLKTIEDIVQSPYQQGYRALRILYEYIFKGKAPESEYIFIDTQIKILESL